MGIPELCKQIYYKSTGYSYTHLGRMFLRMFVGLMMMQFGIRQIYEFDLLSQTFPSVMGMTPETSMIVMTVIEIFCSLCIMLGFLTRLMIVPPFIAMIIAQYYFLVTTSHTVSYDLLWNQNGYLPMMFMGIYFFLLLVGPGKISVDYFLSLHLIHNDDMSESELEEV